VKAKTQVPLLESTRLAYGVECPNCKSPIYELCRTPRGTLLQERLPHFARREAGMKRQIQFDECVDCKGDMRLGLHGIDHEIAEK
jgi:hypothetical protein